MFRTVGDETKRIRRLVTTLLKLKTLNFGSMHTFHPNQFHMELLRLVTLSVSHAIKSIRVVVSSRGYQYHGKTVL